MDVKDKRVLKNGAIGGYVKQSDGSYKWRIVAHSGKKKTPVATKVKKAPTTKKNVPATKKKTTTKKKASKKIQMKGGNLEGVEESELRRIVNQKNKLLSFVKIKLDTYKKSKHSDSNQKKKFEKLLDDLVGINNGDSLLDDAVNIRNVLKKIVIYYNRGRSKNLKFLAGTQKRLSSLFHVYRVVKSVDVDFINFEGKVGKEYRKYNRKMTKKNEQKYYDREFEKYLAKDRNFDLEKMQKKVDNYLEHINKSDRREVNRMIKNINDSILSNRAKYNIMNLIFLKGISYNELETRVRHSNLNERQINNILRSYRDLKTKLDIARNNFVKNRGKQRIDSVKRTKNSKIMEKMMSNKLFDKLEKTELKKYKFDISDKIRQDSDRKLYNFYGQEILKDKYNAFLGVKNGNGEKGHLKNIINYNDIKNNIDNYEGLVDDLLNYRKKYEYQKLSKKYPNIQRLIDNKMVKFGELRQQYRREMNQNLETNINVRQMNTLERELKGLEDIKSKLFKYREKFGNLNDRTGSAKNSMKYMEIFQENNHLINLSKLRYDFMINIFNLFLCYEGNRNNQVCKKYYTEIKLNNDLYTNIMKKAGKFSGNSGANKIAYRMYFIYNQIRDRTIIKKDIEYLAKLAKECNIKMFDGKMVDVLGHMGNRGRDKGRGRGNGGRGRGRGNRGRGRGNLMRNINGRPEGNNLEERSRHLKIVDVPVNNGNNQPPPIPPRPAGLRPPVNNNGNGNENPNNDNNNIVQLNSNYNNNRGRGRGRGNRRFVRI